MAQILDVANYFIIRSHTEHGDDADITILKLQKLCYYAQGVHLASKNKVMFSNDLLAWTHGPAVEALHQTFGGCGAVVIDMPHDLLLKDLNLTDDENQTLEDVYSYFGQFSAWKLRNMTHLEAPWLNTTKDSVINIDLIQSYFKENIIA